MLIEGPQSETHCYLGECFEKLGQIENSRMHYLLAIELNKNCADAHIGLAVLLELENKWRDSLSSYKTALEIDPNHSGYWNMYALACHKCNEIFDAEAAFLKSLSIDKTNAEAWEEYSVFKAEIAGYDKAVSILTEGLTHNTNDSLLQYRLTYYLCQTHKFVEANDLLSLAIKSDPNGLVDFLEYYPEALLNPNLLSLKGHKIIR